MRNRQVGPSDAAQVLADLVPRISYKHWTLQLQELSRGQGCEGLTLCISADVTCSVTGDPTSFFHLMPVPPAAYDEETWTHWVLEQILLVEKHETLEWFKVDGHAPFFPEHSPGKDPYAVKVIKTHEQAHAAAAPWQGGPARDPHFA